MPKKWLPEWVTSYRDRHGKMRYRFRRKGFAPRSFKAEPGTEAFREEYADFKKATPLPATSASVRKAAPGSFDELLTQYYASPDFLNLSRVSQTTYRGIYERWRETTTKSGRRYGSALVRDLTAAHVEQMMADMLPRRAAANTLRKRLRSLMDLAVRLGTIRHNPVISTRALATKSAGFHTFTEEEIAAYEARHPVGTTARLAFDLLLWTGQRGGDVRIMGPASVQGGRIMVRQGKTKAAVSLPIMKPLADSLKAARIGTETFILNEYGATFTVKGFGKKMRQWCDEAGLPHCSAHGLRKAAARRFAEAGCSNQQIKSWTGHSTDREVARYTAAASQLMLSDAAGSMLMANLAGLAKDGAAK